MKTLRALLLAGLLAATPTAAIAGGFAMSGSGSGYTGVSAIMSAGSRAAAVKRLKVVPSVGVINLNVRTSILRDSGGGPDYFEIRTSASKNAAGIRKLRAALSANPVTRRALERRGIDIGRIVGVRIGSNGSLRVYVL
jgi:hypothetical protein